MPMLKIAICDDMPDQLAQLISLTREYIELQQFTSDIHSFSHPDKLLTTLETESFHVYILDIVMPMLNGLELGREIRRLDREAQIIYATTEPQFALQAYASNPINYLIKPVDKQQLFDTLTLAVSKLDLTEQQNFSVKTTEGIRVLKLSSIVCCESKNHIAYFTLVNGEEIVSRTIRERFSDYASVILNDRRFLQCHSSFLVNMKFVERFSKDSFTLQSGKVVPIATKQYAAVRDAYMDYLMAKEAGR